MTNHLRLVPVERLPLGLDLHDGALLAAALDVAPPRLWPPAALGDFGARLEGLRAEGREGVGFLLWFLILKGTGRRPPALIGACGFLDPPDESGTVELRYEVLLAFQRRGLATEGAEALVAWTFESSFARSIRARVLREEVGAMEVLAKLGFTLLGTAEAGRVFLFELDALEAPSAP